MLIGPNKIKEKEMKVRREKGFTPFVGKKTRASYQGFSTTFNVGTRSLAHNRKEKQQTLRLIFFSYFTRFSMFFFFFFSISAFLIFSQTSNSQTFFFTSLAAHALRRTSKSRFETTFLWR